MTRCRCSIKDGLRIWCETHAPVERIPLAEVLEPFAELRPDMRAELEQFSAREPARPILNNHQRAARYRTAIRVAVANLEQCAVAELSVIQHIIRSLKDAMDHG